MNNEYDEIKALLLSKLSSEFDIVWYNSWQWSVCTIAFLQFVMATTSILLCFMLCIVYAAAYDYYVLYAHCAPNSIC